MSTIKWAADEIWFNNNSWFLSKLSSANDWAPLVIEPLNDPENASAFNIIIPASG